MADNIQVTEIIITAEGNPEREKPQSYKSTTAPAACSTGYQCINRPKICTTEGDTRRESPNTRELLPRDSRP
jgi:hypothetical protein